MIIAADLSAAQTASKTSAMQRDASLCISAANARQALQEKNKAVLIDVRSAGAFAKLHIPGSINIPLHFIKTKTFLKSSRVILVSEGYQYTELARACEGLKKASFNVAILNGGLNAWSHAGYPLQGDQFAAASFSQVSPQAFYPEHDLNNWLVMDVSKNMAAAKVFHNSVSVPLTDPRKDAARLKGTLKKYAYKPDLFVLIVNADGQGYDKIRQIIKPAGNQEFFYLQGGSKAYSAYVQNMSLAWKPAKERTRSQKKCATCG